VSKLSNNCFNQKSNAQTTDSRQLLSARKTHCLVRMVRFVATILFVSVACGIFPSWDVLHIEIQSLEKNAKNGAFAENSRHIS
jgi:hypothetical protein